MTRLRIDNGYVVTMDPQRRVIEQGSVAIEDDRIVAVGPTAQVTTGFGVADQVIDARGMAVLPGLIDPHAHAGHSLVKTLGGGDNKVWYASVEQAYALGTDQDFWRADSGLLALERLRAGVTTGVTLLGGGASLMRSDDIGYADAYLEAVIENGVRVVLAVGPTSPPHPRAYRQWKDGAVVDRQVGFEQQFETSAATVDKWHGRHGQRINVALLYPALREQDLKTQTPETIALWRDQTRKVRALSRERGVMFTQDGHNTGSISIAATLGTLGPDALFSHAIDLTDAEIALCGETRTCIVTNPSAVAAILGRCPVPELLAAGATVSIGSDGTSPDRSADMFRHMVQFLHYQRRHYRDPRAVAPGLALEMVTIEAARSIGMDKQIGSLEVGKKADVILIDLAKAHLYPPNMPLFRIVYFANGADVDTVIVDGRVLMQGRALKTVDEARVLEAARVAADRMIERTGLGWTLDDTKGFWGASPN